MVNPEEKKFILSEEALIIKHSGEIPEVAYHNTLYHLTEDPEGPGIQLLPEDLVPLKQAVLERYQWIILRDISPQNRDRKIYRGLKRCAENWDRLKTFCYKEGMHINNFREKAAAALRNFLFRELEEVKSGQRSRTCINCSYSTLIKLAEDMGLSPEDLPRGIKDLCCGRTD